MELKSIQRLFDCFLFCLFACLFVFFFYRALQGEINTIHQLQRHNESEQSIVPAVQGPAKEAFLRHQRERLEAREEVLEEHNYQLQVQLHRLRILLQQVQTQIELRRSQHWV